MIRKRLTTPLSTSPIPVRRSRSLEKIRSGSSLSTNYYKCLKLMRTMIMKLLLPVVITMHSPAQMLTKDSERKVMLNDGISVVIYSASDELSSYYYLPKNIQVSQKNGLPEISLMLYQNEQKQITGGILHVL